MFECGNFHIWYAITLPRPPKNTEIALLATAGTAAAGGLPLYAILCLPILFAAGMSLLDTIDGAFMNFAYDWALSSRCARSSTTSPSPGCRSRSR